MAEPTATGRDPALVARLLEDCTAEELVAQLSCMGRAYELPDVFADGFDVAAFLALVPHGTGQVGRVALRRDAGQVPIHAGRRPSAGRPPLHGPAEPLFAFGHGLTSGGLTHRIVDAGPVRLELADLLAGAVITVEVEVARRGPATHEVLRLHVDDPVASVTRPVARLVDLVSVHLAADGTTRARLVADATALELVDRDLRHRVEPGRFVLTIVGTGWRTAIEAEVIG